MKEYYDIKTGDRSFERKYPNTYIIVDYYSCNKKYVAYIKYNDKWSEIARAENKKDMKNKLDELYKSHIIT